MTVRLPRLLHADLTERARLTPLALELDLQLTSLSTATLTLSPEDADVSLHDLIELYDASGSVGIFRVVKIDTSPGQRVIHLAHGLSTLADGYIGAMSYTGSISRCVALLLGYQGNIRWVAGDCDVPPDMTVLFTASREDALSALMRLMDMLPEGCILQFDQTGPLWQLHIRQASDIPACEGRLSRNVEDAVITVDANHVCTRVYPYGMRQGLGNLDLTALTGQDYVQSAAAQVWGVISRSFTSLDIHDATTLKDVADRYLALHAAPAVDVKLAAADLHALTGEAIDHFRPGDMCRLALPNLGLTIDAWVTALHHEDVYGAPEQVTVTLRDRLRKPRDEVAALLNDALSERLLGGQVIETVDENYAEGHATSPIVHYFTIEDGTALLEAHFAFEPDSGVSVKDVRIDDAYLPDEVWRSGSFVGTGYLKCDALGDPTDGAHRFILYPSTGVAGELGHVGSTVTLKALQSI